VKTRAKVTKEADLTPYLVAAGFPEPIREARFAPPRRWRFDYLWPLPVGSRWRGIALEIQGGVWVQGRHTRGAGYARDAEKLSRAAAMGYCVILATPQQFESGEAFRWLKEAFERR
jgi:hypothetical protein